MSYDGDEHDDLEPAGTDEHGRPIVKHVIRDLGAAVAIRKADAKAKAQVAKAEARARADTAKAQASAARLRAKVELTKLRMATPAREAASLHLSKYAGVYMTLMVLAFLMAVKFISESHAATIAGLITLVITQIGGLLRSIVTENGHGKDDKKKPSLKDETPDDS